MRIGYHASHEQFTPRDLLSYVQTAERAGFQCAMSSDHIVPWSERQGQSGFAYSWVGAALQATTLPIGMITIPMGWRYHPAITAQAGATLAQMFPGRFRWMALGTGEAANERITGDHWPTKPQRRERLAAAIEIIRGLWAGETVTREKPIRTEEAKLYTLAEQPPQLIGAALSLETAEWAGGWADGLITVNQPLDQLRAMIDAFHRGGGAGKPLYLQVHVSIAADDATARQQAFDQWRSNIVTPALAASLRSPAEFDDMARFVRPEDLDQSVRISADPTQHIAWLQEYAALGFEEIVVHNVGRNQLEFIQVYGERVLPFLRN